MAQLMSPVCTDTQLLRQKAYSSTRFRHKICTSFVSYKKLRRRSGRRLVRVSATATASKEGFGDEFADDYYAVLGLASDATPEEIKKAYYNCMKSCHPDLSGNDPETTNFCMFINDVYEVLSDPVQRRIYDEIHGYALTAINPFFDDSCPKDHVFVDEFSCIGCKNCANVAPGVFDIEEDFGRARAYSQCGNPEVVQQAIDSCPVDCIYWTSAPQLSLLEDEMRRVERVNVALMLSGMGSMGVDVFRTASKRWEKRQSKILEQARMRMVKQENSNKADSYWGNMWGNCKDEQSTEEDLKERNQRAAAAARRWREYSRRGADKPPAYKLPEAVPNKDK